MTGKTHAICGIATMVAITALHSEGIPVGEYTLMPALGLLSVSAGAYAPDIDLKQSKAGSKHKLLSGMLTHRGITHTLLVPAIVAILTYYCLSCNIPVIPSILFGFNVGYVAHIVADLFNKKGVPVLWPVCKQKLHIASVLTSSWQETVFLFIWIGVNVIWVCFRL